MDVKSGSMGKPLPGIDAAIARREDDGSLTIIDQAMVEGERVLNPYLTSTKINPA
jgi:acetyl-CoA synthetase